MPRITDSKIGIGQRNLRERPCIMCGGARDQNYAYTTNQGKRSVRRAPRCKACQSSSRKAARARDPAREHATCKAWRERNPEYTAAKNLEYRQSEHGRAMKAKAQRLRKARMRSGQGDTPAIRAIYDLALKEQHIIKNCPVFDLPELGKKLHVDHVIPLSKGGKHAIGNLQILAIGLNMRKGVTCPE